MALISLTSSTDLSFTFTIAATCYIMSCVTLLSSSPIVLVSSLPDINCATLSSSNLPWNPNYLRSICHPCPFCHRRRLAYLLFRMGIGDKWWWGKPIAYFWRLWEAFNVYAFSNLLSSGPRSELKTNYSIQRISSDLPPDCRSIHVLRFSASPVKFCGGVVLNLVATSCHFNHWFITLQYVANPLNCTNVYSCGSRLLMCLSFASVLEVQTLTFLFS